VLSLRGRRRIQDYGAERASSHSLRTHTWAIAHLSTWLPLMGLVALVGVAYAPYVSDYFVGGDTWAHIWTSRDIASVLTQPIMAGSGFPETVARFYRPVSSLSYTLQYALSGLDPVAFHVGDLLIHMAAMLSLAGLAIALGIRPWAAAVGAAVVALHPAMASVVPAAPRRHDSLVAIGLCVGLALATWYVARPSEMPRPQGAAIVLLSSLALAFAELAKEIGYVGLLLVAPTMLAACFGAGVSVRSRWRRCAGLLMGWTATSVVLFVWHAHVVGGLGGYGPLSPFTDLDARVDELVQILLWPFREHLQTYLKAWLFEAGLVLFVAGLPIALMHRRATATLAVGWVWLIASSTFQLMSESTAPWQTYLTIVAFGLMIAAILDGASSAWIGALAVSRPAWLAHWRPAAVAARGLLAASVAGLVIFSGAVVRDSVLLTAYPEWHASASVTQSYLAAIRPCIDSTPPGQTVLLADWPSNVDDLTDEYRLVMAGVFAPYSVAPAAYLTMNHPGLTVQALKSEISVPPSNRRIQATCRAQGAVWLVETVYDPPLQQPHPL
jgi:hypothetical protein